MARTMTEELLTLTSLPLFPLGTVLFPGGVLPLRVFEVRYLDMIGKCHRAGAPFGVVALLVRLTSPGPILYWSDRVGRYNKIFRMPKFRSMRLDAEKFGPALYKGGADPRMTRAGKFLREHHLDELPQLWNVFIGDMSFIGPRPERKFYIDQIMERDPRYRFLYQIRPGVTSYATLYNGYTDTVDKMLRRLRYDLFYLEHRSWLFDFKILVKTFLNIAFGKKF